MSTCEDDKIKEDSKGIEFSARKSELNIIVSSGNLSRQERMHTVHFSLLVHVLLLSANILSHADLHTVNVSTLINEGRYNQATQTLNRLAATTPDIEQLSWIYHQLGEIHYAHTQDYPKALHAYDRIIQLKSRSPAVDDIVLAYIKKGDTYRRMGQNHSAMQTYQALIDHFPPSHFAHQTGLNKIKNFETALNILQVQKDIIKNHHGTPSAIEAQFQIAEVYRGHYQLNQPEQAIQEYQIMLKLYPDAENAPEAQWRIGNLRHVVLSQPNLAIKAYRNVSTNYPASNFAADALFQIARIHGEQNQYEQSASILESLSNDYPDYWNIHAVFFWLGVCYKQSRDYRRSVQAFETFLHVYLPNLDASYFGQIGRHNQNHAQIEMELRSTIRQLKSELPEVEWKKINDLLAASNYLVALTLTRQLIANAPHSEYAEKARSQLDSIKSYASIQNLQIRARTFPKRPATAHSQFQIGGIYERQLQEYSKAIRAYDKLIENFPSSPWAPKALYRTGLIYLEHFNNREMAIQSHERLLQQYSTSTQTMMAHFQLGEIYRFLQRYDEALKAYENTVAYPERDSYLAEGYNDSFADRARFRIGRVHYEKGQHQNARSAFEAFIENRTQSPRLAAAHVYLARMKHESGNLSHASKAYAEAMKLVGDSQIQAEMVVNEVDYMKAQGNGQVAVLERLDELCNLLDNK